MSTESEMLDLLHDRHSSEYYLRIDEFQRLAQEEPGAAVRAAWKFLTESGYIDDGTCCALLEICNAVGGRAALESLILSNWNNMSPDARLNVIDGSGSQLALSTELCIQIFYNPTTNTRQRHRIIAGLVAGDKGRFVPGLLSMLDAIGHYDKPERQKELDRFVCDVRSMICAEK